MTDRDNYTISSNDQDSIITVPQLAYQPPISAAPQPGIGIIGCGGISAQHCIAYNKAGFDVVGFWDLVPAHAEARRDEFYPTARVYDTASEMLADPDITIIDIAVHPQQRAPLVRQAIDAGKHVLSQKPFVVDLAVGRDLVAHARARSVRLAVNQNGRWAPHVSWMRQAVTQGLIGDVSTIHLDVVWDHSWTKDTVFNNMPHLILYDFAIHWFDMVHCYLPNCQAERVTASVRHLPGQDSRPPLGAVILIEYPTQLVTLRFDASCRQGTRDTTSIVGTHGTLRSEGPDLDHQQVTLTTAEGSCQPKLEGAWFPDGFIGTMAELMSAIADDREPNHNAADNLHSLEIAFAAMASAESGQPVAVGDTQVIEPGWLRYSSS